MSKTVLLHHFQYIHTKQTWLKSFWWFFVIWPPPFKGVKPPNKFSYIFNQIFQFSEACAHFILHLTEWKPYIFWNVRVSRLHSKNIVPGLKSCSDENRSGSYKPLKIEFGSFIFVKIRFSENRSPSLEY